ncbi:MAG: cardiolipin synthase [Eubacteriales bacterium]|nr:cardiolipin synthase [Eubacteriales bacterium]
MPDALSPYLQATPAILAIVYIVNFFIAFTIIFLERKNPSATLAWLMILFIVPGFGILLYVMLSQNISRHKIFTLSHFEEKRINDALLYQMEDMKNNQFVYSNRGEARWKDMIRLNQLYGNAFLTQDNRVQVLTQGTEKFSHLLNDIAAAEKNIHIEYFILKPDTVGLAFIEALAKKAEEGVRVRLLLDAMGSSRIRRKHLQRLEQAGGQVAFFFPPKLFRFFNFKLNYRNHRKLAVIDSKVAYLGGFNVANEYVGISARFSSWRDTHIRVEGGCVQDIDARFVLDWRFASGEDLSIPVDYYAFTPIDHSTGIQIVSCGPDSPSTEIKLAYLKMIARAERNVYMQTPYFIPDESIYEALKMAALSGVDVRIMIPNQPDHPFVYWVTYYNVGSLLESGVKVYIYDRGFLHAKMITVDSEVSSVGSANFDIRSFKLNFECNAIMYDRSVAKKLEEEFEHDMLNSFRLTPVIYRNRSTWIKFKESVGRLISDIL